MRFFVAALAILAVGCAVPQQAPWVQAVDRYLEDLAMRGIFQGAVVLGRAGRVTYARGFGFADAERGAPFTVDTSSDGASITKTFTAAAVLKLVEKGLVDLEAPVSRYVPEYPHPSTRVRHLLAHSAGLPDYDWFDRFRGPPGIRGNEDQLALLREKNLPPAFPPGTRFEYDNAAYDAAALLVARVGGGSYFEYLRREFFDPLGMHSTFLRPARLADFSGARTVGYRGGGKAAARFDALEGEAFHGGGNLYLSAMDLHRWASSFVTRPLLGAPVLARGLRKAELDGGPRTRLTLLSWYRSDDGERHYYFGHHQGFYNFAYWNRASGATVAFVSNSNVAATLPTELPRALIAFAEGRAPAPVALPAHSEPPRETLLGPWRVDGIGEVRFVERGAALYMRLEDGLEIRAFRFAPGLYAIPGFDGWLRFHEVSGRPAVLFDSVFVVGAGARR